MTQPKIFYGWVVLFASGLITVVAAGVSMAFPVFFKPIAETFDWGRGEISNVIFIGSLVGGFASIASGILIDRYGARRVLIAGILLLGTSTILMSRVETLWHLIIVMGIIGSIGRSACMLAPQPMIMNWFERRRGFALGMSRVIMSGTILVTLLSVPLIAWGGWRMTYLILGISTFLSAIPLLPFLKERPQDMGLLPDGRDRADLQLNSPGSKPLALGPDEDWPMSEVLKAPSYWHINLMVIGCCTCHSLIVHHLVNFLTDQGLSPWEAASVFSYMQVVAILGQVGNGIVADRYGPKAAISLFLAIQALMLPTFLIPRTFSGHMLAATLFGLGFGGAMTTYPMLFRQFFGEKSIGKILGVFGMTGNLAMGNGGRIGGDVFDHYRNYNLAFLISFLAGLIAAILTLFLRFPTRKTLTPREIKATAEI